MRGAGVLATARKHLQIQYAVAALLPAPLGSVCQVGKLENQRLLLVVPGPAHAAKLRQLAPRIAQSLADQGWNLNEIAVKVQAGLPKPGARQPKPPKEAQPWAIPPWARSRPCTTICGPARWPMPWRSC